jgi:hypothetical protein
MGIDCIVATETRGQAIARTLFSANDAGYRIKFTDIRCRRAPEHDAWAAADKTQRCWEEKYLPANEVDWPTR